MTPTSSDLEAESPLCLARYPFDDDVLRAIECRASYSCPELSQGVNAQNRIRGRFDTPPPVYT